MEEENKLQLISENKCFDGSQRHYQHYSKETKCIMKFTIYIPPPLNNNEKENREDIDRFPVMFFLAGVMCNEQNFLLRMGFQKYAAEHRIIVVGPDTSPRNNIPGDRDHIVFGRSAGWYLDSTNEPWNVNYRMYSYISKELPSLIKNNFPTNGRFGLCGHSMGGCGTFVIGLRNPDLFLSISAMAPSSNSLSWGKDAIYKRFLGEGNEDEYRLYDAYEQLKIYNGPFRHILVDQGEEDQYNNYLLPHRLKEAQEINPKGKEVLDITLRFHPGYDHSYYFAASFIEEHIAHHAKILH